MLVSYIMISSRNSVGVVEAYVILPIDCDSVSGEMFSCVNILESTEYSTAIIVQIFRPCNCHPSSGFLTGFQLRWIMHGNWFYRGLHDTISMFWTVCCDPINKMVR
jgi:hypothetical protein